LLAEAIAFPKFFAHRFPLAKSDILHIAAAAVTRRNGAERSAGFAETTPTPSP
jgi:hypothetical protein